VQVFVEPGMQKMKVVVIGSGIAGLSASAYLAKAGMEVTVLEKNDQAGGRARKYEYQGFTFDMGPSWYWMPEIFEQFYNDFAHTASDFYTLKRLDPSYRIFDKSGEAVDVPAHMDALEKLFEHYEPGSSAGLRKFLAEAQFKYDTGMRHLVHKPGLNLTEFLDARLLKGLLHLDVFTSMKKHIRRFVRHPFLIELLEFPVLFLGATPANTPALYSLMNYADLSLGTWYPMGGMFNIIHAFVQIAEEQGVKIRLNTEVKRIETRHGKVYRVHLENGETLEADYVVGAADYHHIDQHLLDEKDRAYSPRYWESRKMAPSCLLYYVGVNKPLQNLQHHNLFFDADFNRHAADIYSNPQWPSHPLFYASLPGKTDPSVMPQGCENLFLLMPVAPGLPDSESMRERYFDMLLQRLEQRTGQAIAPHILFKRSYAMNDFTRDYNAFKGNAYGLANTLRQTALFKPRMKSKKINNLYYTGQLTVPGPGVPPAIISGKVVARLICQNSTH
jgi:phytoene desaturase